MSVIQKNNCLICPEHVAVIGGGRWGRVLLEVLCDLVPPFVRITAHSPRNAQAMSTWVAGRNLEKRIEVFSGYPRGVAGESVAVIVANAARDHEKAIEWALSERFPVLVEKPVTLSYAATQHLAELAKRQKTYLAAAHVFLFARYIDVFAKQVAVAGGIESVRFQWMDPVSENRHGEAKSFDPGLTIYADWLPHILSILGCLSPESIQVGKRLEVLRGGAHLKIEILLGDIPCEIEMTRNGSCRQRLISVITRQGPMSLDFTSEPGIIVSGAAVTCGDSEWNSGPKPVAAMLKTFLRDVASGTRDERLNVGIGLRASRIIDQLTPAYYAELSSWLSKKWQAMGEGDDVDLNYLINEILQTTDPDSSVPTRKRIEYVHGCYKKSLISSLYEEYMNCPVELIRLIIKQGKLTSYFNG